MIKFQIILCHDDDDEEVDDIDTLLNMMFDYDNQYDLDEAIGDFMNSYE